MNKLRVGWYYRLGGLLLIVSVLIACGGNAPATGGQPVVTIVTPAHGSVFAPGTAVNVQVTATGGVARVELLVDGQSAQSASAGDPNQQVFNGTWTATTAGAHTLTVRAFNAANISGEASVAIVVSGEGGTTLAAEGGPTATNSAGAGPTATGQCAPSAVYVRDVTIPDGTVLPAGQAFVKTWLVRNNGNCAWPDGAVLALVSGEAMGPVTQVPLPAAEAGAEVQVSVNLQAPTTPGQHRGQWRGKLGDGTAFGGAVTVVITVPGPTTQVPPTATTAPLVFNPPFPGGMSVDVSWSDNGLFIRAEANDSRVGQQNGDGIVRVEFAIEDLKGNLLATKTEMQKPYCFFGEADGECTAAESGTQEFRWRNGLPIREGWYFVRAVAYTQDNRIQVDEKPVNVVFPTDGLVTFFVDIDSPGSEVDAQFAYQASPSGEGIDSETGEGILRVEMYVEDYKGKKVSAQPETNTHYCGFGGGDNGSPCPVFNFQQRNFRWPKGDPINPTQYVLRVIAYAQDGRIAANTQVMQINSLR